MIREYFYTLAEMAAMVANSYEGGGNIKPEYIYCQWVHESNDFTSRLAVENHNLGGLCQEEKNDSPQPDGDQYYMNFESFSDYANYFGRYLHYYAEDGIYEATTLEEYVTALKTGGYFGDTLENYIAGCEAVFNENFA